MANTKYKSEKKAHDELLRLLKKHFMDDEEEIKEDDFKMRGKEAGDEVEEDIDYEGMDRDYDEEGEDDDYYDQMMEEEDEDEEDEKLPKSKRKDLAILVLSKKAGRKKT